MSAWYAQYLLCCTSSLLLRDQACAFRTSDHPYSECDRISSHTKCSTISLEDCVRFSRAWSIIVGENFRHDWCTIIFHFRTAEPSKGVSVESYCHCSRQVYIIHNLLFFFGGGGQIRMVSARSVTDSTYWSLLFRMIGLTRGLLTPGTSTWTRDSEVCDSHTTFRPRERAECSQSCRSS